MVDEIETYRASRAPRSSTHRPRTGSRPGLGQLSQRTGVPSGKQWLAPSVSSGCAIHGRDRTRSPARRCGHHSRDSRSCCRPSSPAIPATAAASQAHERRAGPQKPYALGEHKTPEISEVHGPPAPPIFIRRWQLRQGHAGEAPSPAPRPGNAGRCMPPWLSIIPAADGSPWKSRPRARSTRWRFSSERHDKMELRV
jgi:hypothetical protein